MNSNTSIHRVQWKLGTLLMLVTVVAVILGIRQRMILEYQQKRAALSWYEDLDPFFSYSLRPASPDSLAWFIGAEIFQDVDTIHWDLLAVPDASRKKTMLMPATELFARFRNFPHVKKLSFEGRVDDRALGIILKELREVRDLRLEFTDVSPAGLVHVTRLTQLESLSVDILDETSPRYLNPLPSLTHISLATPISVELEEELKAGGVDRITVSSPMEYDDTPEK